MALHEAWACPALLQATLTVLFQLVVLKICCFEEEFNETDLFEQDIAAMCEAQQEEKDEQCEVEEVSDQDYDEIYSNYCTTDVL